MNKFLYFTVAFIALILFSCSQESDPVNEVLTGKQANVSLNLLSKGAKDTKATTGTVSHSDDEKINNYIAFFFTDAGALVSKHYVADPAAVGANSLPTITVASKVYVIANTGALEGGLFADVVSERQLKTVVGSLSNQSAAPFTTSTQTGKNVWMEGMSAVEFNGNQGTASVELAFLAAKIEVVVIDKRKNNDDPSRIQITNTDIVLINAGSQAKFFALEADKMKQDFYFNGDLSYRHHDNQVEAAFLSEKYAEKGVYFYAFGNSSEEQPTILAIKAQRVENNGRPKTVYYPVAFSSLDAGAGNSRYADFIPGNYYKVTITLTEDVAGEDVSGGGGSTDNPEKPVVNGTLSVSIVTAKWDVKVVTKDFN
ncbi:fimbrial protein [Parabacteroides sp.]